MIVSAECPISAITRISPLNMHHALDVGDITSLAASILEQGLLQAMTVKSIEAGPTGDTYEVLAGRRRYQAFRHLVDTGAIAANTMVKINCFQGNDASASLLSIAENIERLNLHPVEQYEAFNHALAMGSTEAEVCKVFGLTQRELNQRLALGRLSPKVRKAWQAGALTAECAKLYTLGSIEEQEALLAKPEYLRETPSEIRHHFRKSGVPGDDPRAIFVGENAYVDAKGKLDKTIFETYFKDDKLLDALVIKKLEKCADDLAREEGWGIILVEGRDNRPMRQAGDTDAFTEGESARLAVIEAILDDDDELDDDAYIAALEDELCDIRENARARSIPQAERGSLAVYAELDEEGKPLFTRGLIVPQPKVERSTGSQSTTSHVPSNQDVDHGAEVATQAASAPQTVEPEKPGKRMREVLNAVIFEALRDAVRSRPDLAVMVLVAKQMSWASGGAMAITLNNPVIKDPASTVLKDLQPDDKYSTFSPFDEVIGLCAETEHSDMLVAFAELVSNAFRPSAVQQLSDLDGLMRALVKRGASLRSCFLQAMDYVGYFESATRPAILAVLDELKIVGIDRTGKKATLAELAATEAKARQWLPHPIEAWVEPLTKAEAAPKKKRRKKDQRSTAQAMAEAMEADARDEASDQPESVDPDQVEAAIAEGVEAQAPIPGQIERFLSDECIRDEAFRVKIADLHEHYLAYAQDNAFPALEAEPFEAFLREAGIAKKNIGRGAFFMGLAIDDKQSSERVEDCEMIMNDFILQRIVADANEKTSADTMYEVYSNHANQHDPNCRFTREEFESAFIKVPAIAKAGVELKTIRKIKYFTSVMLVSFDSPAAGEAA